jgi:tetratricopeptide (TPR) repeat protein
VGYGPAPALITADDLEGAEAALQGVATAGQAAEKAQALLALAGISLTRGQIGAARERAKSALAAAEGLGEPALAASAHLSLAHLERLSGDLTSALAHAEAACRSSEGTGVRALGALHLRALLDLEAGRMEEAEKHAEEIKELVGREKYPKLMRVYYHLLGHRELLKGDTGKAIDHFWKALNLLPSPAGKSGADIDSVRYYYDLVEAYRRSGAHSRALQAYQDIPPYWEQRTNSGDVYARSFFSMARCLEAGSREFGLKADEQASLRVQAADHYRKFLSLFGEADPRFAADVEEARNRLAGLSPGSR